MSTRADAWTPSPTSRRSCRSHAFAETNGSGTQDALEPFGDATKVWTVPPSKELREVKIERRLVFATNGDSATFGGNAAV